MKKISKKDSDRILNHLKKARTILDKISEDDEIELSDTETAEDCLSVMDGIILAINNTIL